MTLLRLRVALLTVAVSAALAPRALAAPFRNPNNGHYYEVISGNITWTAARDAAATRNYACMPGHLVTITNSSENDWVLVSGLPGTGPNLWLGGFQNRSSPSYSEPSGGWQWVTGELFDYQNWAPGEPNDDQPESDYLEAKNLGYPTGWWNDEPNNAAPNVGYIVEYDIPSPTIDPDNGHSYEVINGNYTWHAARQIAESRFVNCVRGHLVTITSFSENSWVLASGLPGTGPNLWLGGFQNHSSPSYSEPSGGWQWVTGEPFDYQSWALGEPNNDQPESDYLESKNFGSPSIWWNDEPDSVAPNKGFIVEYDTNLGSSGDGGHPGCDRDLPFELRTLHNGGRGRGGTAAPVDTSLGPSGDGPSALDRSGSIIVSRTSLAREPLRIHTDTGAAGKIYDFTGRCLFTYRLGHDSWDGRDKRGRLVPTGFYSIVIEAPDGDLRLRLLVLP